VADEAVLNIVRKKKKKSPQKERNMQELQGLMVPVDHARVCTCSFFYSKTYIFYGLLAKNVRRPEICTAVEAEED
jgi:hypothetical protein